MLAFRSSFSEVKKLTISVFPETTTTIKDNAVSSTLRELSLMMHTEAV